MNRTIIAFIILIIFTALVGFVSYKTTYSFFSDTDTSTNNVFTAASEFPPSTNHIVISEVQTTGGNGQDQDKDFIELFNPTNSNINLDGYRLVKRTGSGVPNDTNIFTFTASHTIPAHGYFLWASSSVSGFSNSIGADVTSSQTLARPNNSIALRQGALDTGAIIDALSWSSTTGSLIEGTQFSPDLDANQSMERKALSSSTSITMTIGGSDEFKGNGFDSNNNLSDFILRTFSQPQNSLSPTETP